MLIAPKSSSRSSLPESSEGGWRRRARDGKRDEKAACLSGSPRDAAMKLGLSSLSKAEATLSPIAEGPRAAWNTVSIETPRGEEAAGGISRVEENGVGRRGSDSQAGKAGRGAREPLTGARSQTGKAGRDSRESRASWSWACGG